MEVPRLGVNLELQLPAYTTATAMWDPATYAAYTTAQGNAGSLNPLSEARDGSCILMDTSWIHFRCTTEGTPQFVFMFVSLFWFCKQVHLYLLFIYLFIFDLAIPLLGTYSEKMKTLI